MKTSRSGSALGLRRAYRTQRLVEELRAELEGEWGPIEVAVDEDGRCVISFIDGSQSEARLSSCGSDPRVVLEEVGA